MSSLRKAFLAQKTRQNEIISEAAVEWLNSNVILINEKIDRKTVNRLIVSIQKFDDTFGPYKEKLPALGQHLDMAERGLNLVITGKISDRKTSNMLEQLTYLYSAFSNFFTRDLPILLKTGLFKIAKDNPEMSLSSLQNFDSKTVREALSNALKPSFEERKLLAKIYRGSALPKLNTREIANQMMELSFSELEELTNMGKVPMAVSASESPEGILGLPEAKTPKINKTNVTTSKPIEESYITPEIAEAIVRKTAVLLETDEKIIKEVKMLLEATLEEVQPKLEGLKKLVNSVEILKPLAGPVSDLQSKVLQVLADGDVKSYLAQITTGKGSLGDLFKSPKGKILGQANLAIETMNNVAKAWSKIAPILEKDKVVATDIANVKKILTNEIKGGIMQRLKSLFGGVGPFPGLTPDDILKVLFKPLDTYLNTEEAQTDLLQAKITG